MNKRQKLVQQAFLNNEEVVIKRLKQVYNQSLNDITKKSKELQDQINSLGALVDLTDDEAQKATLKSMQQAKVYQKQYQDALKKQVSSILDNMQVEEFKTVADYLEKCYEEGFLGTMYDLHGQGIPLIMPLDQEAMVRAVQTDSKISQGLYTRLGEDVALLKKKITAQVSRGISTGASFAQVAQQLAAYTNIGFNNAVRIARTEGHRIQVQSGMEACYKAKDKGADVVKQWDSSMDRRTRPSHARVDGEIRELDEPFSNGLMYAGDPNGGAAEVVNCRCALLQRARWALEESELETLKERADYFGLDKNDSFEDFKKKYLKAVEDIEKSDKSAILKVKIDECETVEEVQNLFKQQKWFNVQEIRGKIYNTNDEIDLTGCELECAKEIFKSHQEVFEKYPQLIGKLNSVNAIPLDGFTYAQCHMGLGHGGINVNVSKFKDVAKLAKSYDSDLESGFHPKGTDWTAIVTHEIGHAIDDYLTNTLYLAGFQKRGFLPKYVSADLRPKVMRACGLKVSAAYNEVSGYATKNAHEWFAECFAEYMKSENPRKVATEFGKQLEEIMKGVQ